MSISNTTNVDSVNSAVQSLSKSLNQEGKIHNELMLEMYTTSICLIICVHLVFAYQWKKRTTRKDVISSYRTILVKRQYHRALISVFSHPMSDRAASHEVIQANIPMGNEMNEPVHSHTMESSRSIAAKIKIMLRPFINGPLSGLPSLAYVSHIIWQCRALEELFDYSSDRHYASMHHSTFNTTAIIASDSILQKSFRSDSSRISAPAKYEESYQYHRVVVALMFTSLFLDLIATHIGVKYFQGLVRRTSAGQQMIDRISDRGICSLAPLSTALLVIYSIYFPHTSISVLPLLNTTRIGLSSSGMGFALSYIILSLLSYRSYPLVGMLCGSMSGLLFTNGFTTFLAGSYSGNCLIVLLAFLVSIGYKAEYLCNLRRRRTLPGIDWLPCIDSVLWDENGQINSTHVEPFINYDGRNEE